MKLYVANCTHQNRLFTFRLIEQGKGYSSQPIPMGRQEQIGGDLNRPQLDSIVDQHKHYGMRHVEDLAGITYPVPLIYSVDKPVSAKVMEEVVNHNRDLLRKQGSMLRRDAAIATSHGMREYSPQAAETMSMSIEEEKTGTMDHGGDQPLSEGFRISREVIA